MVSIERPFIGYPSKNRTSPTMRKRKIIIDSKVPPLGEGDMFTVVPSLNTPPKTNGWNPRVFTPFQRKIIFQPNHHFCRFYMLIFEGVSRRSRSPQTFEFHVLIQKGLEFGVWGALKHCQFWTPLERMVWSSIKLDYLELQVTQATKPCKFHPPRAVSGNVPRRARSARSDRLERCWRRCGGRTTKHRLGTTGEGHSATSLGRGT